MNRAKLTALQLKYNLKSIDTVSRDLSLKTQAELAKSVQMTSQKESPHFYHT